MDYGIPIAFIALVVIALVTLRQVRNYHHVTYSPRAYNGDRQKQGDWFDPVRGYFAARFENDQRVAAAVNRVCFSDKENGNE